jgi:filamentous hemagglutinin
MQNAHGDGNSDAAIQNASHVSGANSVTVVSGGDTNITGSQVSGGQVTASVGGNLNIQSVQDTTVSTAHQSSAGGGFSVSQAGGSASFSAQNGHADGNYAQVNEQAGINAGNSGFDVNVKGNTNLTGAVIDSTADASKNSLTTGTLTFGDIQNQSHYSASSNGVSAGVGVANTGKALGPGSVGGTGGVSPMISQNDNGDENATTRSAVSAGSIDITDQGAQTQDVAGLSRDTTNSNGKVSNTPDLQNLLSQQADTMQAAQAAGQVVSQGIGAYADAKRNAAADAVEAAAKSNDPQALAAALADYSEWREGGDSRAALQAAGGALIGGLGGGAFGAVGGAAGAAISSKLADQANALADAVAGATGSSLIGNISGNILSGLAGGIVGGSAGAAMASNVNLYNQSKDTDAAAKDARVKRIVAQALGNPPDLDSFSVSALIGQFIGMVKSGAAAEMAKPGYRQAIDGINQTLPGVLTGGEGPPMSPGGATAIAGARSAPVVGSSTSQPGTTDAIDDLSGANSGYGTQARNSADNSGAPPPNMSPDSAGRSGAFNEAKRNAGVPVSQQPIEVRPNVDRQGNVQPGYQYVYEVPSEGGGVKEVIIRDDASGHFFGENNPQNRGAHFNDPAGNHYDY